MPLTLPVGDQDKFYLFGTAPFLGALLAAGQTVNVVSADTATVSISADSPAKPVATADGTPTVPAGTPTIFSGTVVAAAIPAQPNVAIAVTATVLNADGSTAETLTDTVTVSPQAATAIGDLFGVATPVASTVSAPQVKKA